MSFDILVNNEVVKTLDDPVLEVSLVTDQGEKARVRFDPNGSGQLELLVTTIAAGGNLHLSQVEEAGRLYNKARTAGLPAAGFPPETVVTNARQRVGTSTVDMSPVSVEDAAAGRTVSDPVKRASKKL